MSTFVTNLVLVDVLPGDVLGRPWAVALGMEDSKKISQEHDALISKRNLTSHIWHSI